MCGPVNIQARGGFEYFVIFTDNYSKYGYIYLSRYKFKCFEKFKEFKMEMKKRHNKHIYTLQSDHYGDTFLQNSLNTYQNQELHLTILLREHHNKIVWQNAEIELL